MNRLNCYLDFSTRKALITVVERYLIAEHVQLVLTKGLFDAHMLSMFKQMHLGLDNLLEEDRRSELQLMYKLFSRVKNGLVDLKLAFANYIKVVVGIIYRYILYRFCFPESRQSTSD